ncbi:MFS transporter [Lacticaseibacillus baoqingensis]|uniref:MFS transporter n=1 Tax=Lacticaseibacillus baoqingensis TaxID=2486013 RepID=A0ABW4E3N1_9LACO
MSDYSSDPTVQKHRWWILLAVGMFTIMSTLDGSIVNIALPVMAKALHIPMNQAEWVVLLYLIVICALLLLMGRLGDLVGKIRVFRFGTGLFVLGSFLAGFNHSLALLLCARFIQAIGAAMTMANNNGIITAIFPPQERGQALGLIGSFVAVGSIAGPGIGGLILGVLPWGYIFWINVPIGIATMIVGHAVLPKELVAPKQDIDWAGFGSYVLMIVPLFLGVAFGQEQGFLQPQILALFGVGIVGFWGFGTIERHRLQPLVPLRLFANGEFTLSLLSGFLIFVVNFFSVVITPFYLENARGFAPTVAGNLLMVFPVVQVVIAPMAGALADKIGPYLLTVVGLSLILIAQIGYVLWQQATPMWGLALVIAINGLGNGIFQSPNNTMIMSAVAASDLGIAGGLNALARNFGMVVGISAATTTLFATMSQLAHQPMTTYPLGHNGWFIVGMHGAFVVASGLCLVALGISGYRLVGQNRSGTQKVPK